MQAEEPKSSQAQAPAQMQTQAPAKVLELVEKFERDQDIYRSGQYNETELRTEFINPFFEALGWDVYHRQECRADKREVKEEDAVDVEGKIKNPDYSFRLFDKRKFFVEVKRPSINIESGVYPAYQIRRYAWSPIWPSPFSPTLRSSRSTTAGAAPPRMTSPPNPGSSISGMINMRKSGRRLPPSSPGRRS